MWWDRSFPVKKTVRSRGATSPYPTLPWKFGRGLEVLAGQKDPDTGEAGLAQETPPCVGRSQMAQIIGWGVDGSAGEQTTVAACGRATSRQ